MGGTDSYGATYRSSIGGDLARDRDVLRIRSVTPRQRDPNPSLTLPRPLRLAEGDVVLMRSIGAGRDGGAGRG